MSVKSIPPQEFGCEKQEMDFMSCIFEENQTDSRIR